MAAPVGRKKVHRYTVEFKNHAVKLAQHPDTSSIHYWMVVALWAPWRLI